MSVGNYYLMKPKVDFCFKELMKNPYVRLGFVSALLKVKPEEIEETTLLPTVLDKRHRDDKLGVLDVLVMLKDGTRINIEMQVAPYPLWPERSLYYWSRMFADQLHEGEDYEAVKRCIHVGILNFILYEDEPECYSCFRLLEDSRHTLYTDKLEIHILELPKLKEHFHPETELLEWARFFGAEKKEEFEKMAEKNEYIHEAYETLQEISADEKKRLQYEARHKAIKDHLSFMNYSQKTGREEGRKEGAILHTISLIRRKRNKGMSPADIAEDLMESLEYVERISDVIQKNAGMTDDEILAELKKDLQTDKKES